ncbi:MAG TPA: hypothetical protein VMR52_00380 [Dehalococcoidia bacterium]|nr:hypothetical protein [Dehalococcoidia bacterium]
MDDFLETAEPLYRNISQYVHYGLAVFDEHNTEGHYEEIHRQLTTLPRHRHPVFRVVDKLTREASLRPVSAGAVIFNLPEKRIVQLANTYREITRIGRAHTFDGSRMTDTVFRYRLPEEWALVP